MSTGKTDEQTAEFSTEICLEKASEHNPFIAKERYIKGYDIQSLWRKSHFIEVLLLHFLDDIPSDEQRQLVEMLFIGLMNLGPRDVENRAAMIAGISKTRPEHLLALGLLAGEGYGANVVMKSHFFLSQSVDLTPSACFENLIKSAENNAVKVSGFGTSYGDIDPIVQNLARDLLALCPDSRILNWCEEFVKLLNGLGQGWLATGLVAAVSLSLNIGSREAMALYQLAKSVGIVAYGVEQTHFPIKNAPMLSEEYYEFKGDE